MISNSTWKLKINVGYIEPIKIFIMNFKTTTKGGGFKVHNKIKILFMSNLSLFQFFF